MPDASPNTSSGAGTGRGRIVIRRGAPGAAPGAVEPSRTPRVQTDGRDAPTTPKMQARRDAMRSAAERRQADLISRRDGRPPTIATTPSELGRSIGTPERDTTRRRNVTIRFGDPQVAGTSGTGGLLAGGSPGASGAVTSSVAPGNGRGKRSPIVLYTPPRSTPGAVASVAPGAGEPVPRRPAPNDATRTSRLTRAKFARESVANGGNIAPDSIGVGRNNRVTPRPSGRPAPSLEGRTGTGRRGFRPPTGSGDGGPVIPGGALGGNGNGGIGSPTEIPGPPPGSGGGGYASAGPCISQYCLTYQVPYDCSPAYSTPFNNYGGYIGTGWNSWSSSACCPGGPGHLSCYNSYYGSGLSYHRYRRPWRTWYAPSWRSYGLAYDTCSVDYGYGYGGSSGYVRPAYNAWWTTSYEPETDYYAWWLDDTANDQTAYVSSGGGTGTVRITPEAAALLEEMVPTETEASSTETFSTEAAWSALEADDLQRALDVFGEIVRADERNAEARIGMAIATAIQGNDRIAIDVMREAVRIDPGALALVPHSTSLDLSYEAVASHYGARIKVDLDDVDALFMIAATRYMLGDNAVAFFAVDSAVRNGDTDESSSRLRSALQAALSDALGA